MAAPSVLVKVGRRAITKEGLALVALRRSDVAAPRCAAAVAHRGDDVEHISPASWTFPQSPSNLH
jgi:hypothetical protein